MFILSLVGSFFKRSIFKSVFEFIKTNMSVLIGLFVFIGLYYYHAKTVHEFNEDITKLEVILTDTSQALIVQTNNLQVCKEQQIELKIKSQVDNIVKEYDQALVHELQKIEQTPDWQDLF